MAEQIERIRVHIQIDTNKRSIVLDKHADTEHEAQVMVAEAFDGVGND